MFVKPAEGLTVRRPTPPHQILPEGGAEVSPTEAGGYWTRRVAQGDVIDVTAQKQAEAAGKIEAAKVAEAEAATAEANAKAAAAEAAEAEAAAQTISAQVHS